MMQVYFPSVGQTLELKERYALGDSVDEAALALLHNVLFVRLRSRIAWRLSKGKLPGDPQSVTEEAVRLWSDVSFEGDDLSFVDDPVDEEAFRIAKELITAQLAREGLMVPKGIDDHARTLASESAAIRDKAKARVEAQRAVALAAVKGLES